MSESRRVVRVGVVVGGVTLIGLGVLFVVAGLDKADKIASILGAFIGLVGLVLAGYGVVLARRALPERSSQPRAAEPGQSVSGAVGGDNIQFGSAGGDVNIDRR
jgi:drug/metabolite transporter (DMT)-like permease